MSEEEYRARAAAALAAEEDPLAAAMRRAQEYEPMDFLSKMKHGQKIEKEKTKAKKMKVTMI